MTQDEDMSALFDVTEATVVDGAACTWCGVTVGEDCAKRDLGGPPQTRAHAQRWRDYWNATHDRRDWTAVYPAPWRREATR